MGRKRGISKETSEALRLQAARENVAIIATVDADGELEVQKFERVPIDNEHPTGFEKAEKR